MPSERRGWPRFLGLFLLVGAGLAFIWPVHALATRYYPLILGVPFSVVWIVIGQATVFTGLLILYLTED